MLYSYTIWSARRCPWNKKQTKKIIFGEKNVEFFKAYITHWQPMVPLKKFSSFSPAVCEEPYFIDLYIHIIYMLAISGKTAVPNWLNIFEGTHGYPGDNI